MGAAAALKARPALNLFGAPQLQHRRQHKTALDGISGSVAVRVLGHKSGKSLM